MKHHHGLIGALLPLLNVSGTLRVPMAHLIGALLALLLLSKWCVAQDWPGNPAGNPLPQAASVWPGGHQQPVVAGPPIQPPVASRPATWPGSEGPAISPWVPPDQRPVRPPVATSTIEMKPCEGAAILAHVGSEVILASEVMGSVNETIEQHKTEIPASQLEQVRKMLIQQRLKPLIETKLIFLDAKHTIPAEAWPRVEKDLGRQFEEFELPSLMKKVGVSAPRELDQKLRAWGTSLDRLKRASQERTLVGWWIKERIDKQGEEPNLDQMVGYYHQHQDEFTTPARARWEELMVRYSKHDGDKRAALEAIVRLGNRVVIDGAPLAEVAKAASDGVTANDGGCHDWTTKKALVCEALDRALFDLPVGQLSPIIEGPVGFHIIRVTEREPTTVKPFLEAQGEIKEKIKKQRSEKLKREYMAKLEAKTPVWTIFDEEASAQTAARPQPSPL